MADDQAPAAPAQAEYPSNMSVEDAVAMLTTPRASDGKFAPREQKPAADVVDIKTAKPMDPAKAREEKPQMGDNGGPPMEDDEFFEWAPEKEGEPPRRVKADEVFAAYDELPKLRKEYDELKAKATATPPEVFETVRATMEERGKLIKGLDTLARALQPERPDPRAYVNDPEGFRQAMENFEAQSQHLKRIEAERAHQEAEQKKAEAIVHRATVQRVEREIVEFWPEMKDAKRAESIIKRASELTGFKPEEILNTYEPRMWRVLKDFLEFHESKAKQAEAVKVARAKPKLVKGAARPATTTNDSRRSSAMSRFEQTNSVEDAIAFLTAGRT